MIRSLARLDRIYSFQPSSINSSPIVEYYIRGDSNHSDHLLVWGRVLLQTKPSRKSSYKMNAFYLDNKIVQTQVTHIWLKHQNLGFTGKLRRVVKYYKLFCVNMAKKRRAMEEGLRRELSAAVTTLQSNPNDDNI